MEDKNDKNPFNKIGIIIPSNIRMAPYLKYYTSILEKTKTAYITISWNRFGINEHANYVFNYRTENNDRKRVLCGHILFARYCKKIIKNENVNKLIILTLAPAFFLGNNLLNKYQDRLIIDVRDDTPFRKHLPNTFLKISDKAFAVIVSSYKYSEWFNRDTIVCHNADANMIARYKDLKAVVPSGDIIRVVFAGSMRESKENIKVIEALKNDDNYSLLFIGRENAEQAKIRQYVNDNNVNNVSFEGAYKKEDIIKIYRDKADLVNAFREKSLINTNALPNKLYDAVLSGIPIVVFRHNEAMSTYVEKYSLGIIMDGVTDEFKQTLLRAIKDFDYSDFDEGRQAFINKVEIDIKRFEDKVLEFVSI